MEIRRSTIAKALVVVFVLNLVVMGAGALYSYQQSPPIPKEVVDSDGETLVTAEQVRAGKKQFQRNGLMNHGSVLGNGAYYGQDLTAWALDRKVAAMRDYLTQGESPAVHGGRESDHFQSVPRGFTDRGRLWGQLTGQKLAVGLMSARTTKATTPFPQGRHEAVETTATKMRTSPV